MLMVVPTNVVVIGGLAVAKVGFDRYIGFMLPLMLVLSVVSALVLFIAASV
ncbi:MAG: hypothetical protein WCF36_13790 [Candidatus Nanopelagicales bacterium]